MMNYRDEETYHLFENQNSSDGKQEFEFKDSYWDEMEEMLDAHDTKKRKRRGAFLWFSSAAVIGIAILGLYQFGLFDDASKSQKSIVNESISVPTIPVADKVESNTNNTILNTTDEKQIEEPLNAKAKNTIDISTEKQTNLANNYGKKEALVGSKKDNTALLEDPFKSRSADMAQRLLAANERASDLHYEELANLKKIPTGEISTSLDHTILLNETKTKFPLKHSLSFNAEAGIVNKYASEKGISYGVSAGLGYELTFHKNLAFQTGVNFTYREGLAQNYVNESRVYGFSSERYFQDVKYKGQFNLEIPVALKVKFNRSSISAGVAPSFLLGVRSTVKQHIPESEGVEEIGSNFGIRDGIRSMDVNLNLQYAYALTPNLELTAGFSAGLLDQTSNEFFGNTDKDHNLQFRMGIKYFFFNK